MTRKLCLSSLFLIAAFAVTAQAQTGIFTYQGRLTDGTSAANGTYQMQFSLFDSLAGPTQIGLTIPVSPVTVTNGVFTVNLDFSADAPFATGANRWLEIAVRKASDPPGFTTLTPRQQITSAPYAVKSLKADLATNSTQLGGVAANQYVVTTDTRLSDERAPTAGSTNYIQNQNAVFQTGNFTIDGMGTASVFRAESEFRIGPDGVLSISAADNKLFVGKGAGDSGLPGISNATAIGPNATVSQSNSLVLGNGVNVGIGTSAPQQTLHVVGNGLLTGNLTVNGAFNATLPSGSASYIQNQNAVFQPGNFTINGTGTANTLRAESEFRIGADRVLSIADSADNNLFVGKGAGSGAPEITNATAIGTNATVSQSNSLVLGNNANVGIGTTAPEQTLHVNGLEILSTGSGAGFKFRDRGSTSATDDWVWYSNGNIARFFRAGAGDLLSVQTNGNVGIGTVTPNAKLNVVGNVTQDRGSNGLVKAMIFVSSNGTILRCFNGITNSSSGNCGFSVSHPQSPGGFNIDFGFRVDDRFVNLTLTDGCSGGGGIVMQDGGVGANSIRVVMNCNDGTLMDRPFYAFVF